MNDVYGRADGGVLLAPERDARTGNRVPSRQSRRDKRSKRTRVRTRPLTTALVASAAVVALPPGT